MQAVRFMRRPFFATGYMVTALNMKELAEWCNGSVISGEKPFIRVPVLRAANPELTKAYIGQWIIVSVHNDKQLFKIYRQDRLLREFIQLKTQTMQETFDLELPSVYDPEYQNALVSASIPHQPTGTMVY